MGPSKLPISFSAFSLRALVHRRIIFSCGTFTTFITPGGVEVSPSDGTPRGSGQTTSIHIFRPFSINKKSGPPCEDAGWRPTLHKRADSKASETRDQNFCSKPEHSSLVKLASAKPDVTNELHALASSSRYSCVRPQPGNRFRRNVSMSMTVLIAITILLTSFLHFDKYYSVAQRLQP